MRRVPPPPEQVRLWTGDRVRVEAVSNRHGFITVFNVGPTGNLSLLYPDQPGQGGTFMAPIARANQTLHVQDVEMTPPAGRERLFAVWSRQPLPLRLDRLQGLVETTSKKSPASRPYVATRDMKRVQQSVEQLDPGRVEGRVPRAGSRSPGTDTGCRIVAVTRPAAIRLVVDSPGLRSS